MKKLLGFAILLSMLFLFIAPSASANEAEGAVRKYLSGDDMNVAHPGELLYICLAENKTTPYNWFFTISDPTLIAFVSDAYVMDDNPQDADGVGGTSTFCFRAIRPGTCTIQMNMLRDEEDTEAPIRSATYEITIEEPAATSGTLPSPLPTSPFVQSAAEGDIIYLGMRRDAAEAIAGSPMEEGAFGKEMFIYESVTMAYRDEAVVYIQIHAGDVRWAANGLVTSGMPTEEAATALGMAFVEGSDPHILGYYEDGTQRQLHPKPSIDGSKDYQWALTIYGKNMVGMIDMGDRRYLTTRQ